MDVFPQHPRHYLVCCSCCLSASQHDAISQTISENIQSTEPRQMSQTHKTK